MCNFCKELIACPVGQKRRAVLCDYAENGSRGLMEVVVDHYRDHKDVFMHAEYAEENGWDRNMAAEIKRCPFCGARLGKEEE